MVENYRNSGRVCHRVVVTFGLLETLTTETQLKLLAQRVEQLIINGGNSLYIGNTDDEAERLVRHFYQEMREKDTCDVKRGDWETVNLYPQEQRYGGKRESFI